MSRTAPGGAWLASTELARFVAHVQDGDVPMGPDQTLGALLDSSMAFIEPQRSPTTKRGIGTRFAGGRGLWDC
jgi:hypothetical protein